jgi:carbon storage regulator
MTNLVLTRKPGDTILLGDSITITFLEVVGAHVRVSIEAPREISIRRGELVAQAPGQAPAPHAGDADKKTHTTILKRRRKFIHQSSES